MLCPPSLIQSVYTQLRLIIVLYVMVPVELVGTVTRYTYLNNMVLFYFYVKTKTTFKAIIDIGGYRNLKSQMKSTRK